MADRHLLELIIDAKQNVSGAMKDVVGSTKAANKESKDYNKTLNEQSKATDRANNSTNNRANLLEKEASRIRGMNSETRKSSGYTNSHVKSLEREARVLRGNGSLRDKATSSLRRLGAGMKDVDKDTNRLTRGLSILRKEKDELAQSSHKLTQQLGRLGRATLGIAVAGVIVFMRSFVSMLTAALGQAVALGSSLGVVATTLGGVFVAGLAQAIPVIGLFAAALQRLSAVQDAVTAKIALQKAALRENTKDVKANTTAQDSLADGQRGVLEAQQALTQARRDAKRELQDLVLAERDAELAARGAAISQSEAQRGLRQTIQGGDVSSLASDELGVTQSAFDRVKANVTLQRSREDAQRALRGGVNKMPDVIAATRALSDANRQLARSQRDAGQAAQTMSAQEGNLQFYLAQLSPTEKQLYERMVAFKNGIQKRFTPITDIIISSLVTGFDRANKLIFSHPILTSLKNLATTIGDQMDRISGFLTSSGVSKFFQFTMREAGKNIPILVTGFETLLRIFMNIARTAAPALTELLHYLVHELKDFLDITNNDHSMRKFFERGVQQFKVWFNLLEAIIQLLGAIAGVSGQSAVQTLTNLTKTIDKATQYVNEHRKVIRKWFNETADGLSFMGEMVVAVGKVMVETFSSGSIKDFASVIDNILLPALETSLNIVSAVTNVFAHFLELPFVSNILAISSGLMIAVGSLNLFRRVLLFMISPFTSLFEAAFPEAVMWLSRYKSAEDQAALSQRLFGETITATNVALEEQNALLATSKGIGMPVNHALGAYGSGATGGVVAAETKGPGMLSKIGSGLKGAAPTIGMFGGLAAIYGGSQLGGQAGGMLEGAGFGASVGGMLGPWGLVGGTVAGAFIGAALNEAPSLGEKIGEHVVDKTAKDIRTVVMPQVREAINTRNLPRLQDIREGITQRIDRAQNPTKVVTAGYVQANPGDFLPADVDRANKILGKGINKNIRVHVRIPEEDIQKLKDQKDEIDKLIDDNKKRLGEFQDNARQGFRTLSSGYITDMQSIMQITNRNFQLIDQGWVKHSKGWKNAVETNTHYAIEAVRRGVRQNVITEKQGQREIEKLRRSANLKEGINPQGAMKAYEGAIKRAGGVTPQILSKITKDLSKMPPIARQKGQQAIINLAAELEDKRQIVRGSTSKLTSKLTAQFGLTFDQLFKTVSNRGDKLLGKVKDVMGGSNSLGNKALGGIFDLFKASGAPGSGLINIFSQIDVKQGNYIQQLKRIANQTDNVRSAHKKLAGEIKNVGKEQDDQIVGSKKQGNALKILRSTIGNVAGTSKGLGDMFKGVTNGVLKAFGAKELNFTIPSLKSVLSPLTDVLGFATGGYFGRKGERKPDDRLIKVAGGEAILTGKQQAYTDAAMQYAGAHGVVPYRNLDTMFARERTPHNQTPRLSHNRGGKIDGYVGGGRNNSMTLGNPRGAGFTTAYSGPHGTHAGMGPVAKLALDKFGLSVSAGRTDHSQYTTTGNVSDHFYGNALDLSNGVDTPQEGAWFRFLTTKIPSLIDQAIYQQSLFENNTMESYGASDHHDHVHTAILEPFSENPNYMAEVLARASKGNLGNLLAGTGAGGGGKRMQIPDIKRILVGGPKGTLKNTLQGQADHLRKSANAFIQKKAGAGGVGVPGGGGGRWDGRVPQYFQKYNHNFAEHNSGSGDWGGYTMPFADIAALAEWAGRVSGVSVPGISMAQITKGESTGRPGSASADNGFGLWAITYPYAAAAARQAGFNLGSVADYRSQMLNPVKNALVMARMFNPSTAFGPTWHGDEFVTGHNLHYHGKIPYMKYARGGRIPNFDMGGVIPGPVGRPTLVNAHAGETILPTHKIPGFGSGGKNDFTPGRVSAGFTTDQFGIGLGALTVFNLAKDKSKDLIAAIQNITDGLDTYTSDMADLFAQMSRRIQFATYKIRRGVVAKVKSSYQEAFMNLNSLEDQYTSLAALQANQRKVLKTAQRKLKRLDSQGNADKIQSQIDDINKQIKVDDKKLQDAKGDEKKRLEKDKNDLNDQLDALKKRLKKAGASDDKRDALRTLINNITDKITATSDQISQNLVDRYQAQADLYQAAMDKLDAKLGDIDIRENIADLQGQLKMGTDDTVNPNKADMISILQGKNSLFDRERQNIQRRLRQAQKTGDKDLIQEMKTALLENKQSILENSVAIKGLKDATEDNTAATTADDFSFKTTMWELYRVAILNGSGGIMPSFAATIPHMASGGMVTKDGLVYAHAAEVITPADKIASDANIYITEPMEVADPIALSNSIVMKMNTHKAVV